MKKPKIITLKLSFAWFLAVFVNTLVMGCAAVGPDYSPPEISVSPAWHTQLKDCFTEHEVDPESLAEWWTTLNDHKLSGLIKRASASNLDLKKARARIRESRARRGITRADFFPTLDATGSASWSRTSEDRGAGKTSDLYSASFDAGWELDIFGGVRRSAEAAEADLQATRENLRDVMVSLLAEVALNYLEVRTFQTRLNMAEANLEAQAETHKLILWRYQAGLSDELALQQASYNLENTRSQIPTLRTGLQEAMNRVAVLLGEQPGKVHDELEKREPIPIIPLKVVIGFPADVLRRRPDVRQAERELAAQTARIGVATADLYPRFRLKGSIGLQTLSLSNPSSSDSRTISGGPGISWAIFDAGAIRNNIEVQSALQEQALIKYETTILDALEEIENSLVAYAGEQQRRDRLLKATQAAKNAADLAQHKYEAGLTDFSNILDAQRSLLSFQDQLAQSEGTVTSNLIRIYKALGGGWSTMAFEENTGFLSEKTNEIKK